MQGTAADNVSTTRIISRYPRSIYLLQLAPNFRFSTAYTAIILQFSLHMHRLCFRIGTSNVEKQRSIDAALCMAIISNNGCANATSGASSTRRVETDAFMQAVGVLVGAKSSPSGLHSIESLAFFVAAAATSDCKATMCTNPEVIVASATLQAEVCLSQTLRRLNAIEFPQGLEHFGGHFAADACTRHTNFITAILNAAVLSTSGLARHPPMWRTEWESAHAHVFALQDKAHLLSVGVATNQQSSVISANCKYSGALHAVSNRPLTSCSARVLKYAIVILEQQRCKSNALLRTTMSTAADCGAHTNHDSSSSYSAYAVACTSHASSSTPEPPCRAPTSGIPSMKCQSLDVKLPSECDIHHRHSRVLAVRAFSIRVRALYNDLQERHRAAEAAAIVQVAAAATKICTLRASSEAQHETNAERKRIDGALAVMRSHCIREAADAAVAAANAACVDAMKASALRICAMAAAAGSKADLLVYRARKKALAEKRVAQQAEVIAETRKVRKCGPVNERSIKPMENFVLAQ